MLPTIRKHKSCSCIDNGIIVFYSVNHSVFTSECGQPNSNVVCIIAILPPIKLLSEFFLPANPSLPQYYWVTYRNQ